ncbi:MAG: hypothetical protein M0R03_10265 [Novosphingobium sp.]|nr:hypothetical protein [Novosphingobium sp.]
MEIRCVAGAAGAPLDDAARFHTRDLPEIEALMARGGDDLTLVFPPADHAHRGWRLAVVQELARRYAPLRINAVASDDEAAIAATLAYLARAPGVTGQYLPLDSQGAKAVIVSGA